MHFGPESICSRVCNRALLMVENKYVEEVAEFRWTINDFHDFLHGTDEKLCANKSWMLCDVRFTTLPMLCYVFHGIDVVCKFEMLVFSYHIQMECCCDQDDKITKKCTHYIRMQIVTLFELFVKNNGT